MMYIPPRIDDIITHKIENLLDDLKITVDFIQILKKEPTSLLLLISFYEKTGLDEKSFYLKVFMIIIGLNKDTKKLEVKNKCKIEEMLNHIKKTWGEKDAEDILNATLDKALKVAENKFKDKFKNKEEN